MPICTAAGNQPTCWLGCCCTSIMGYGVARAVPWDQPHGQSCSGHLSSKFLKEFARVPTSVHTSILLCELGQRPLEHLWWRRAIRF